MNTFFETLLNQYHIDPIVLLLVIAAGFFQKQYCGTMLPAVTGAVKTLAISFIFFISYMLIKFQAGTLEKSFLETYFISYAVATSFYEILLKKFLGGQSAAALSANEADRQS